MENDCDCFVRYSGHYCLVVSCGDFCFDLKTVLVAIPPLVGGLVSSLVMSEAAQSAGLASLSVLAILIYVIQGFAGYPLTSIVLKRRKAEASRISSRDMAASS